MSGRRRMFKAPRYSRLLDPKQIPEGYLRKLFDPCLVTEHDFFLAVTEAHRQYQAAFDRWMRINLKGVPKGGFATTNGVLGLAELDVEALQDDVVWLIGGLLGRYDEVNNAKAIAKMQELLKASKRRSKRKARAARLKPKRIIGSGEIQVPFSVENTQK